MKPEISKTKDETPKTSGRFVLIFFGCLTVFVYFFGLTIPLLGPDEPRYAQVAREMLERGDWITPTLGGFNWFEKPPLLYWLEMISYKLFGVSEFAARLGPALFGLGTVTALWLLGRSLAIKITGKFAHSFAEYLALIAASTFGIMVFSRGASFDIIITFPITASLVSFFVFYQRTEVIVHPPATAGSSNSLIPLFIFYVFIGVALLAKGLIGIIFPFSIVAFFYLSSRRLPGWTFFLSLFWGALLAIAIASVWYLPMYWRHGYLFIDEFFVQHHFQRFTSNKYQHPQPIYFYLWVFPLMTLPWLPFFLSSIWHFLKQIKATKFTENSENLSLPAPLSPLLLFSIVWLIVPLVFFSFSGSKLPGYILPAIPGAVIMTSILIFDLVTKNEKWRKPILFIAAFSFAAAILLITFAVPRFAQSDSVKSLIEAANERGYTTNRVITLHTISHNAEFYAAGRLLRDANGKLQCLSTITEVANVVVAENNTPVLVLVPPEYLSQLTENEKLKAEPIDDNGELAIAAVSLK